MAKELVVRRNNPTMEKQVMRLSTVGFFHAMTKNATPDTNMQSY